MDLACLQQAQISVQFRSFICSALLLTVSYVSSVCLPTWPVLLSGCWLLFLALFLFLIVQYLRAVLSPPPPTVMLPPAPLSADGTSFALADQSSMRGGRGASVTVQSEAAKRLAELHQQAAAAVAAAAAASNGGGDEADPAGDLEQFYSSQRLREQQHAALRDVAAGATGRYEHSLGQPKQWQPSETNEDAAAVAAMAAAAKEAAAKAAAKAAEPVFSAVPLTPSMPDPPPAPAPTPPLPSSRSPDAASAAAGAGAATQSEPNSGGDIGEESPVITGAAAGGAAAAAAGASVKKGANQAASDTEPSSSSTEKVTTAQSAAHSSSSSSSSSKNPKKDKANNKANKADSSKLSGASALTSPSAPLADDVDVSRLYDSEERRAAREKKLSARAKAPLPEPVLSRSVNNVVFTGVGADEAPLNEEWSELLTTSLAQSVAAPSVVTSLTSPDGGLEVKVFLTAEGRVGYSAAMRGRYSTIARQMKAEGTISSLDEASGTFLLPALLDLSVDNVLCLLPLVKSAAKKDAEASTATLNWQVHKGFSLWHPVPKAERSEYAESWTQLTLWNGVGSGKVGVDDPAAKEDREKLGPCGAVQYQFRLFNTGVAVRALVQPTQKAPVSADTAAVDDGLTLPEAGEGDFVVVRWSMGLRLQDGLLKSRCIANNYEEPFVRLSCARMADAMMTPLVIEQAKVLEGEGLKRAGQRTAGPAVLAVAQASGPLYVRSTAVAAPRDSKHPWQTQLVLVTKGEAPLVPVEGDLGVEASVLPEGQSGTEGGSKRLVSATSWHVVLMGAAVRHLAHASHLTPLLCSPPDETMFPAHADSRWVPHGKLMRITKFSTQASKDIIDWASAPERGFKLVLFDAGWYGDEYKKESQALEVLPSLAPELDIATVARYAIEHGMRLCLYVNELALRDTERLVPLYANQWGVGGVKFGFVEVGDPRSMRVLHQRILAFGNGGLYVNIHDSYRPRGLTRTWPFLVTQEGVRGEERKPDATHHTILPFVRTLQGAADYTPRYLNGAGLRCTKAHQLALPLAIFSPIQSLFWAEPLEPVSQSVAKWNRELDLWMRMPSVWDDTRFLAGVLGEVVAVARRSGRDWFVGVMGNEVAREITLDLGVLFDEWAGHPPLPLASEADSAHKLGLLAHVYRDGYFAKRKDPFSVKAAPRVLRWIAPPRRTGGTPQKPPKGVEELADGLLTMSLAPSGGQAVFLTPATPAALEEVAGGALP
jgi:hypothetical protein